MIYRCSKCDIPCILSIDGRPSQGCPNLNMYSTHAEWVEIEGMFSTVVPA